MADFTPHEAPAKDIKALPLMHPGKPAGRDELLKDIYNHLRSGRTVLLHGAAGVGKTALAATLAAAYTQQPGGVLWLDATDAAFPGLLVRVGRAYHLMDVTTSENPTALVGSVASTLMQHKPFIVLDNVTQPEAVVRFIEKCVTGLPVLVISQQALDGPWTPVQLNTLDDASAVLLFKQKAGIQDNNADRDIQAIARLLGNQPFPLVIAARGMFAAKQPPGEYLKALQQVAQATGGDAAMGALAASYRTLNNALQGLVLMLGAMFRGETSAELLEMVSGVPLETINQTMTILSQLYLVEKFERGGHTCYRMHPFVHQFAQNALKGSNRLEVLQAKVVEAVLNFARKYIADHQLLSLEMDNFIATARHVANRGERDTASALLMTLTRSDGFVTGRGYVYEILLLRNLASGSTSAFPAYGPEPVLERPEDKFLLDMDDEDDEFADDEFEDDEFEDDEDEFIGSAFKNVTFDDDDDFAEDEEDDYFDDGDTFAEEPLIPTPEPIDVTVRTENLATIDVDQLRLALNQAKAQRDFPRQIQILKAIGKVLVGQDKPTEAIATYNEILTLYENVDDDEGTLETLDMLSALLAKTNNSQAAIMHATRGIPLAEKLDDQETKIHLLLTMGDARQDLGETDAAAKMFAQALEMTRKADDRQNEAIALYKLGYAQLDNGSTDSAIHSWEQARELFKAQGRRNYEGRVLGGLGSAYSDMERWSEAMRYFKSALHIAREVGDKNEEGLQLGNLGQAQVEANQLPEALLSYRQALHLAYESGDRRQIVNAIVDLVGLMLRSNRLLAISELLLQDALALDPHDRDVTKFMEDVARRQAEIGAKGISQANIGGTAREYAANAYALLEA